MFEPEEFVEVGALEPPSRFHLARWTGMPAPGARLRAQIVPEPPERAGPEAPASGGPAVVTHRVRFAGAAPAR